MGHPPCWGLKPWLNCPHRKMARIPGHSVFPTAQGCQRPAQRSQRPAAVQQWPSRGWAGGVHTFQELLVLFLCLLSLAASRPISLSRTSLPCPRANGKARDVIFQPRHCFACSLQPHLSQPVCLTWSQPSHLFPSSSSTRTPTPAPYRQQGCHTVLDFSSRESHDLRDPWELMVGGRCGGQSSSDRLGSPADLVCSHQPTVYASTLEFPGPQAS